MYCMTRWTQVRLDHIPYQLWWDRRLGHRSDLLLAKLGGLPWLCVCNCLLCMLPIHMQAKEPRCIQEPFSCVASILAFHHTIDTWFVIQPCFKTLTWPQSMPNHTHVADPICKPDGTKHSSINVSRGSRIIIMMHMIHPLWCCWHIACGHDGGREALWASHVWASTINHRIRLTVMYCGPSVCVQNKIAEVLAKQQKKKQTTNYDWNTVEHMTTRWQKQWC
jgi:hypothetical protein